MNEIDANCVTMRHDIIKVMMVQIGALGVTLANIEAGLTIVSLLVTIMYVGWKWYNEYTRNGNKD